MTSADDPYTTWDASYVFGALSADDRRDFELHLRDCSDCQAAVAHIAGMPGVLAKVATSDALEMDVVSISPVAHHAVQDLAREAVHQSTRRRRRAVVALAAAAVLLFSGGVALGVNTSILRPEVATAPISIQATPNPLVLASVGSSSVTGEVRLVTKSWGTQLTWSCDYGKGWAAPSYPQAYSLVVTDASGAQTVVGTWLARDAHTTGLFGSTSVSTVKSIEIRQEGSMKVLASARL